LYKKFELYFELKMQWELSLLRRWKHLIDGTNICIH